MSAVGKTLGLSVIYAMGRKLSVARSLDDRLFMAWRVLQNPSLRRCLDVPSHLTARERIALHDLALGKTVVAEIGSYVGASACSFGEALRARGGGRLLCIDTWNNDAMSEGSRDTWVQFKENVAPYSKFIVPIRGYSSEVADRVAEQTDRLDLLFIDGDHSYEGVKADWDCYKRFLDIGSVVVFHDYGWAEGVQRVVDEQVLPLVRSQCRLPNLWWGKLAVRP